MSLGEAYLDADIMAAGLPAPECEYRFAKPRMWRMDFAWPERLVACEVEGGTFLKGGGRHNRGASYEGDCLKYSEAAIRGWRVVRVTTQMVQRGEAIQLLRRILEGVDGPGDEEEGDQDESASNAPGDVLKG